MSLPDGAAAPPLESPPDPKRTAHALYLLLLLSLPTGISLLVALVWAHRARAAFAGSWLETHRSWQMHTAWAFIAALALALWLRPQHETLALLLLMLAALNFLDCTLRGWIALDDGLPITLQHPRTLLRRLLGEWRLQTIATLRRASQSRLWLLLRAGTLAALRLLWRAALELTRRYQQYRQSRKAERAARGKE